MHIWWSMGEHKKPNRVELHVIPISIQGVSDVGDSIDSCMETRKKEVLTRNRSAVSSVCPSRKSYTSRRCFTAIERPKRSRKFCQACAYQDVKQIEQDMEVVIFFSFFDFLVRDMNLRKKTQLYIKNWVQKIKSNLKFKFYFYCKGV